jgi:hypothetical protein
MTATRTGSRLGGAQGGEGGVDLVPDGLAPPCGQGGARRRSCGLPGAHGIGLNPGGQPPHGPGGPGGGQEEPGSQGSAAGGGGSGRHEVEGRAGEGAAQGGGEGEVSGLGGEGDAGTGVDAATAAPGGGQESHDLGLSLEMNDLSRWPVGREDAGGEIHSESIEHLFYT